MVQYLRRYGDFLDVEEGNNTNTIRTFDRGMLVGGYAVA